jgi:hypothetical protein
MNHVHELKALAAMARTIPQNEFNMGAWWAERENGCGTFGCVIGHGIAHGVIRGGLRMDNYGPVLLMSAGASVTEYEAIAVYFGITEKQAIRLFSHGAYRSVSPRRETVARRIEQFVAKHTSADRVIEIKGTTMKNRQNDFDMTKVLTVRREIEAGVYENDEKHEVTADRLLDDVLPSPAPEDRDDGERDDRFAMQ